MNYNSQYFNVEDRKQGKDLAFIKCLLELNQDELMNDLHIHEEEGALIVEWIQKPYSGEYGGAFLFVDEDQAVMEEITYPDNSSEWIPVGSEKDFMEMWYEKTKWESKGE